MAHPRSSKPRAKSRSPAPLRTPTTPGQFFPPSYFAAAAGVSYRNDGRPDDGFSHTRTPPTPNQHDWNYQDHLSANASYLTRGSPLPNNRHRQRSQLGDLGLLESQLLPTLSDTVDRMTRPPSQAMPSSPFRPSPTPEHMPGVARTPSCSSQSSSAYSGRSEPYCPAQMPMPVVQPTSVRQPLLSSPSVAHPQPEPTPLTARSSTRSNPKSILKSPHVHSDPHLQVRQAHLEDVHFPSTENAQRKAGRSPVPRPLESIPSESRIVEQQRQAPCSPRFKNDNSSRIGRARSRTDPGTLPKSLPSNQGRSTQQQLGQQPSGIPRRVGIPPSPAIARPSTNVTRTSDSGSDAGTAHSTQREKRRLFVTNADIASSSSTDSPSAVSYVKPKALSRTDSQSSTESQLRPPRFGLGLGLSGVNDSKGLVVPAPRWPTKTPREESSLRRTNSPSNGNKRRHRDRSPSSKARTDFAEGQRRHRELISLMDADLSESSGFDSPAESIRPSGSERSDAPSDGSGNSLRPAFDDSGSEYSPTEEHDEEALRRPSSRWEHKAEQMRGKARVRQSRDNLLRDDSEPPIQVDDQHTPKALSTPSFFRQLQSHRRGYPTVQSPREEFTETESSSSLASEENGLVETQPPPERYSSELSRIMTVSNAAEARQRQAFGIDPPLNVEDRRLASCELPHSESDLSSIGGDRWQDEYDELDTGSILQQPSRTVDSDERAHREKQLSIDQDSLFSAQTHSSVSQESIYSTQNSSTRGSMTRESPPPISTAREQQWQVFERHVLDSYGEAEARRQRLVWELVESEDNFVTQLQNMVQLFISPLRVRDTRMWVSGIPSDVAKLFDWLDDIVRVHAQLSSALVARQIVDHPRLQAISEVFRGFIPRLETYQPYLVKLEFVASVIDSLTHEGKNDFGDFIRLQEASERCQGWTLERYLIEPVDRLAHYPEVFRRLLQLTPKSHPDYMSTLSLYHAAKLTIRVLSEVKDCEDAYELVKMACSGIEGIPTNYLAHRHRRLLIRGSLTCVEVSSDEQIGVFEPPTENQPPPRTEVAPNQRIRRSDKLSKAIKDWRGRSNSIKSTASTVVSFSTAPSSFDVHAGQRAIGTPVVRVESEPVEVEVFVFTDMVLLVSPGSSFDSGRHQTGSEDEGCNLVPLERFGLSRVVSVLDEIDPRACVTLDLSPLTTHALEAGRVQSTGPVTTISLSQRPRNDKPAPPLSDWLSFLRQSCQYTLRSLSSLSPTSLFVNGAAADADAQKPVFSLLAAGLPFPKSPSMQIEESERGWGSDSGQQEREERGWWSKRFHEVFLELSRQDVLQC